MEGTNNCSSSDNFSIEGFNFVVENVMIPVLGSVGIVGNVLAILVLKNPDMKSTFHQSLIALASCDIVFLSLMLLDYTQYVNNGFYIIIFPYFLNPLKNILLSLETFLIMSISTERVLAVCKPVLYRTHKLRHSSAIHLLTYILPPIIFSLILNIPKFLEAEFYIAEERIAPNVTQESLKFRFTELRLNPTYIYYYTHWTRLLCTGIIPFFYLLIANGCIFRRMRSSNKFLISGGGLSQKSNVLQKSSKSLFAIVILYLISNTPRLLLNCVEYQYFFFIMDINYCESRSITFWFDLLLSINHLSLIINSSANILIYCTISRIFKNRLFQKLKTGFGFSVKSGNNNKQVIKRINEDIILTKNIQTFEK